MPDPIDARPSLTQQALDLRAAAVRFRRAAEGARNRVAKDALLGFASDADRMASRLEVWKAALGEPLSARSVSGAFDRA